MTEQTGMLIGKGEHPVYLNPRYANRHGLIAGATGTGKTVTVQVLAEQFSRLGVPVFLTDVKGDMTGISQPGSPHPKVSERIETIGITDFEFSGSPTVLWDLFGEQGHPIRATVADMGPTLLARLMDLNETQEGVLAIAFEFADDEGMLMLDFKDLRETLQYVGEHAKEFKSEYGNVSSASVGAIQRRLLILEQEGAEAFFGEPALDLWDFMRTDHRGRGHINLLIANRLMTNQRLYATFLLWLLSELFENLPEVGDLDKPRFVFFFDEAHLLFDDAPKALLEKVETVVRLIRSKGVGIYFCTQNPLDIPDSVLGQLGNRVQHALRAFTPRDQKAVRSVAQTMRANPAFDTTEAITQMGVGVALVSTLEGDGVPSVTEKTLIRPPYCQFGPASESQCADLVRQSPLAGRYDAAIDRESAFEILAERAEQRLREAEAQAAQEAEEKARQQAEREARRGRGNRQSIGEAMVKSLVRSVSSSVGRTLGRQILRGLLGGVMRR
ncbi:MAG: helicase HerA-like domain-containing protein [Pseudomonadota bacterium]